MDPGIAAVVGSTITTAGVVFVAFQNKRQGKQLGEAAEKVEDARTKLEETQRKVAEVHKTTTTNHHSSPDPTLLDRISNMEHMLSSHIQWHKEIR